MSLSRDEQPLARDPFRISRRRLVGGASASAAALALGGGLAARGVRPAAAQGETGIIIGTLGEAENINPFRTSDSESDFRCKMLYDEFVRSNVETYAPEPGLAASWQIDGLDYVFTLQPNARFSDGTEVTAEDVAFTLRGMIAGSSASPRQSKYLSIQGAQEYADGVAREVPGIQVVDPKTLRVTLAQPDAPFLYNMRFIFVVPAAPLQNKSLVADPFFQNPIGAGPYVFQSWEVNGDFVATANPNYWQTGKPVVTPLTHRVIPDANSLVLALESGDIDASNYAAPTEKARLEGNPELQVLTPPFASPNGWMFNCRNPTLANRDVRRAIAMAVNTEQFVADALLGLSGVGRGPIAPGSWAHDPTLAPIPYDPEQARTLLQGAGVAEGTELRFTVNQGNIFREDWLTFTQQALEDVGIRVIPEAVEYAGIVANITGGNPDFDVSGVDFAGVTAEPSELYEQFHSSSPGNYSGYANPELDQLLTEVRAIPEIEAAKPVYQRIQQIIMDDVPMHFAWYRPFISVVGSRFQGVTLSAAYGPFHVLEDWTVGPSA